MTAIGIDLGGTTIKAVAIDGSGNLLQCMYAPTRDDGSQRWKEEVKELMAQLQPLMQPGYSVGISAPGLPDETNHRIAFMPGRMAGLEGFDWTRFTGHPVWVLNDAVAALLAEARLGAASSAKHVLMVTLGTGVGGALLIHGKPYQGAFTKAGHIGHMVINEEEPCDITGMPGSLEDCIGNCSVEQRSGGRFSSTHDLLEACRAGDGFAQTVWQQSVRRLAIGLASLTNILSPELIVIGGGIAEAGDDLFVPLEAGMAEFEWRPGGHRARIVKATCGDLAGAQGAALFALEQAEL